MYLSNVKSHMRNDENVMSHARFFIVIAIAKVAEYISSLIVISLTDTKHKSFAHQHQTANPSLDLKHRQTLHSIT